MAAAQQKLKVLATHSHTHSPHSITALVRLHTDWSVHFRDPPKWMQQHQRQHNIIIIIIAALHRRTRGTLLLHLGSQSSSTGHHTHTHKQTNSLLLSLPLSCSQLLLSFVLCLQVLSFLPFLSLLLTTAALREHRCNVPQVSAASVLVSLSNALPLRCQHSQTLRAEHRSEKKKEKEKAQRMRSSMATLN